MRSKSRSRHGAAYVSAESADWPPCRNGHTNGDRYLSGFDGHLRCRGCDEIYKARRIESDRSRREAAFRGESWKPPDEFSASPTFESRRLIHLACGHSAVYERRILPRTGRDAYCTLCADWSTRDDRKAEVL